MPKFIYSAKSQPNTIIQGDIEASSEQDAINQLTKIGYFPLSIRAEGSFLEEKHGVLRFRKISRHDMVLFTRQLSTLIESGVNILNSLNIISNQTQNRYVKLVINDMIAKIKDGRALSESLALHPSLFSNLYISMIRSGESGGNLEAVLSRLADFLEKEEEFKNSLRAALTYPLFVFIVGIATVIIMVGFVVPRLTTIFKDMGEDLPLATKILINTSQALRTHWWFMLIIIGIFILLLRRVCHSPQGKVVIDRLKLKTAIFGNIVLKTEIGRLMRTLSLLLSSGMPIVSSLDISTSVVENQILRVEMEKFKDEISRGLSFSQCLKGSKWFPFFVVNIVTVGEETGTLEKSLLRIADEYEKEVDRSLKTLTRMLEPVIILVMGLIVGFIVLSILLPIFQISFTVK